MWIKRSEGLWVFGASENTEHITNKARLTNRTYVYFSQVLNPKEHQCIKDPSRCLTAAKINNEPLQATKYHAY